MGATIVSLTPGWICSQQNACLGWGLYSGVLVRTVFIPIRYIDTTKIMIKFKPNTRCLPIDLLSNNVYIFCMEIYYFKIKKNSSCYARLLLAPAEASYKLVHNYTH